MGATMATWPVRGVVESRQADSGQAVDVVPVRSLPDAHSTCGWERR
jgi:hypothetical protein